MDTTYRRSGRGSLTSMVFTLSFALAFAMVSIAGGAMAVSPYAPESPTAAKPGSERVVKGRTQAGARITFSTS